MWVTEMFGPKNIEIQVKTTKINKQKCIYIILYSLQNEQLQCYNINPDKCIDKQTF